MKWLTNYRLLKMGQAMIYTGVIIALLILAACFIFDINKTDMWIMLGVPKFFLNTGVLFFTFAMVNYVINQITDEHEKKHSEEKAE